MLSGQNTVIPPHSAPGLSGLAGRYDVFIVDQWGVLHDGENPYPGAADCLRALKEAGKKVVVLTNSGRRARINTEVLAELGFERGLYDTLHSSGEAAWRALRDREDPVVRGLGRRCLLLARRNNSAILEGLDLVVTDDPGAADFVFNTGVDPATTPWDKYLEWLAPAADRGLPMVCANPDVTSPLGPRMVFGAGALADWYGARGCPVVRFGKPDAAMFETCLKLVETEERERVLVVGDSLDHDIRGAMNAGFDSAFVAGGIHADTLRIQFGEMPSRDAVTRMAAAFAVQPVHVLPNFVW